MAVLVCRLCSGKAKFSPLKNKNRKRETSLESGRRSGILSALGDDFCCCTGAMDELKRQRGYYRKSSRLARMRMRELQDID